MKITEEMVATFAKWAKEHAIDLMMTADSQGRTTYVRSVIQSLWDGWEAAHLAAGEAREVAAGDIELVAQWFYEEMRPFDQGDWRWPEHENDDGYRGERARVCLAPSDVQAKCRDNAKRLLGYIRRLDASPTPAAAVPPAGAGEWQPMDTAPKDGTEIIGYRPDQGVFVFRWAWMEEFVPKDQHGDPTEPYDEDFACWWHDRWDWMEGELTPTLWQPLPAAPGDGG